MKKTFFITLLAVFIFQNSLSQEKTDLNVDNEKIEKLKKIKLSFGTNIIDNSNGNQMFWRATHYEFKSPVFISIEYDISSAIAIALTNSINIFEIDGDDLHFFGVDFEVKYFFPIYPEITNVDFYFGIGSGQHFVGDNNALTFNLSAGINYWTSNHIGLTFNAFAKAAITDPVPEVRNFYQYNLGLIYKFK